MQVHFGADYTSGEYGWTTSLKKIKESVRWQMEKLRTDYIDFGFIHCMDEERDLNTYIKNGVLTVVPGYGSEAELMEVLNYFNVPEEQKDYSVIAGYTPKETEGVCVCCKHCHPCPAGLDITLINKYYDLMMLGDNLAREHYLTLEKTAGDCISCGHCDSRCPFHVRQSERMKMICEAFGK